MWSILSSEVFKKIGGGECDALTSAGVSCEIGLLLLLAMCFHMFLDFTVIHLIRYDYSLQGVPVTLPVLC